MLSYVPKSVDHIHCWQNGKEAKTSGDEGVGEGVLGISICFVENHGIC